MPIDARGNKHRSSEPMVGGSNPSGRTSARALIRWTQTMYRQSVASASRDPSKPWGRGFNQIVAPFFSPFRCRSMQSVPVRGELDGTNTGTMGTYTGTV